MIVKSIIATAIFYLALYPKRSKWGIERITLTGFWPCIVESSIGLDIYLDAFVQIINPNLFGSELERARYEVFVIFSPYQKIYLGLITLDQKYWIPGANIGENGVVTICAQFHLQSLNVPLALRLLHTIFRTGSLDILALGTAQVNSLSAVKTLVGIKCVESISIAFWSSHFLKLNSEDGQSNNCEFTYQPLPRYVRILPVLPLLDRRYIHNPIGSFVLSD